MTDFREESLAVNELISDNADKTIQDLKGLLGSNKVETNEQKTEYYRTSSRSGGGQALAVIFLSFLIRRNDENWVEELPESISSQIECSLYYGHFFCHVFHQDYILKKGADAKKVKSEMLALLDSRGAKYPAEHNVGHLYEADSDLQKIYLELDPSNTFNPGVGKMEKHKRNCSCCM